MAADPSRAMAIERRTMWARSAEFDRKHRWDGPSRSEETEMNRSGGIGIIGVIVIVVVVLFVLGRL